MSDLEEISFDPRLAVVSLVIKLLNTPATESTYCVDLLMIPFCWIVFYYEGLYPREGHFLWNVGMVLALFSNGPSSSRSVTAGSQP